MFFILTLQMSTILKLALCSSLRSQLCLKHAFPVRSKSVSYSIVQTSQAAIYNSLITHHVFYSSLIIFMLLLLGPLCRCNFQLTFSPLRKFCFSLKLSTSFSLVVVAHALNARKKNHVLFAFYTTCLLS